MLYSVFLKSNNHYYLDMDFHSQLALNRIIICCITGIVFFFITSQVRWSRIINAYWRWIEQVPNNLVLIPKLRGVTLEQISIAQKIQIQNVGRLELHKALPGCSTEGPNIDQGDLMKPWPEFNCSRVLGCWSDYPTGQL